MSENEVIARAAGLDVRYEEEEHMFALCVNGAWNDWLPDWRSDPCACVLWLLPVLEARMPHLYFGRAPDSPYGLWYAQGIRDSSDPDGALRATHADTWHACVIAAILATAPEESTNAS